MSATCFDCGATLNVKLQAVWTCSNAACPTGTEKHLCGYCRESSFSPISGICANPACRTHKIVRNTCPTCQYQSVLTLGGMKFCLNRSCGTHAGWVTACPACSNDSLIQLDGTAVCVKSTCANLLYLVPWPAGIGNRRGLGGSPPAPKPRPAASGTTAPGTTALRRYQADPDAETVVPGNPPPATDATSQDPKQQPILPAKPRQAVDPSASTVVLPEAAASAPRRYQADPDAATVVPGAPQQAQDPRLQKILPPKPRKVDPDATTVLLPEGFDEDAETVLAPSGQLPQGRPWSPTDNTAETVLTDFSPPQAPGGPAGQATPKRDPPTKG
jgi:hypothetical protein